MENYNIKILTDYLDKNGVIYKIELNPSPEKIKEIEEYFKRKEQMKKISLEFYNLKK